MIIKSIHVGLQLSRMKCVGSDIIWVKFRSDNKLSRQACFQVFQKSEDDFYRHESGIKIFPWDKGAKRLIDRRSRSWVSDVVDEVANVTAGGFGGAL